jgi:hypothetical protein
MPAKAGTQRRPSAGYAALDPRFRGGDGKKRVGTICLLHTTRHRWRRQTDMIKDGDILKGVAKTGAVA